MSRLVAVRENLKQEASKLEAKCSAVSLEKIHVAPSFLSFNPKLESLFAQ